MELEKKKTRPTKRVFTGPIIKYQSLTMPLVEELQAGSSVDSLAKMELDEMDESRDKRFFF